ncbi:hypothetical protein C8Q73DRAFT_787731 [Cubamyces lactineus]|nr:hypothetical protein C8Q73DRAFT_787731 [Cubamyces lactineus]
MQQATPNAATAKFQLALPFILSPISSHLAALHATRARLLHPADSSLAHTHCSHCGTPFLSSGGRIRSIRKRKKRKTPSTSGSDVVERVLRRSCRACGRDDDVPLSSSTAHAPTFPKVRDRPRRNASAPPRAPSVAPAVAAATPPAVPATAQHAPASQSHASRSLLPATASSASSRSSSRAPSTARPSPAPGPAAKAEQIGAPQHGPSQPKARPKKKAGLQSLLERNREKQEQEKKREGQGQGLSAFLQGL